MQPPATALAASCKCRSWQQSQSSEEVVDLALDSDDLTLGLQSDPRPAKKAKKTLQQEAAGSNDAGDPGCQPGAAAAAGKGSHEASAGAASRKQPNEKDCGAEKRQQSSEALNVSYSGGLLPRDVSRVAQECNIKPCGRWSECPSSCTPTSAPCPSSHGEKHFSRDFVYSSARYEDLTTNCGRLRGKQIGFSDLDLRS